MARAYATINNGGYRVKAIAVTRVRLADGKVDKTMGKVRRTKVFTDGQAYEGIQAMKANISSGTGTAANLPSCTGAGKTGTTSGFKDAWFNGMTRGLNTAVWVGYPGRRARSWRTSRSTGAMFGGTAPALIWHDYMLEATKGTNCTDWPQPKTPFVAEPFYGKYSKSAPQREPSKPYDASQSYAARHPARRRPGDPARRRGRLDPEVRHDDEGAGDLRDRARASRPGSTSSPPQKAPATPAAPASSSGGASPG